MKNIVLFIAITLASIEITSAQNDTLYIYKNGKVVVQKPTSEIDSIIFYNPLTRSVVSLPIVTTTTISKITQTTAESGGNITSDGNTSITARGICWSTNQGPTLSNNKTSNGTGKGIFTSSLSGLTANTKYYVRAYATNSKGTYYGNELSFTAGSANIAPTIINVYDSLVSYSSGRLMAVINPNGLSTTVYFEYGSTSAYGKKVNASPYTVTDYTIAYANLTNLYADSTYHFRVVATNTAGVKTSSDYSFKTLHNQISYNKLTGSDYTVQTTGGYSFKGIIGVKDFVDSETGVALAKIEYSYRFGSLLGEPTNSGILRWTTSTGKNQISTIKIRAKIYNNQTKVFTGSYHYYSPLVSEKDTTWSWDVSGSPAWDKYFVNSSGAYIPAADAKSYYFAGFYLDDMEIVEINGKVRIKQ